MNAIAFGLRMYSLPLRVAAYSVPSLARKNEESGASVESRMVWKVCPPSSVTLMESETAPTMRR